MKYLSISLMAMATAAALTLSGCAGTQMSSPVVSILVDLDPASSERTVIIENITADRTGVLFTSDRVTGTVLRVDPNLFYSVGNSNTRNRLNQKEEKRLKL